MPDEVAGPIRARPAARLARGARGRRAASPGVPIEAAASVPAAGLAAAHQGLVHPAARRCSSPRPSLGGSVLVARRLRQGPGPPPRHPLGAGGRMILTVTLNTAIDKTLAVPNFRLGRRHRTVEQTTMPGGKGVNVARVLKTLGAPVIATGLAGGATGHAHRRAAHAALRAVGLRAHPRGVAHEHGGHRPDDGRADGDQRARAVRLRAGDRAVRRQAALPRQGRVDVRVRRARCPRNVDVDVYARADPGAQAPRRRHRGRHGRRPAAPRRARRARRDLPERARGRGARRPRVQRRGGPLHRRARDGRSWARARRS